MRQYIGARYVPRFTGLYDATRSYEALDVVDNGSGTSYIAKIPTPANTPLSNTNYWSLYGSTNGAIINLQEQIDDIKKITDPGVFHKNTTGIYEDGVALSAISNNADGRPEVMGFRYPSETATYHTRDGVGLFASIRGKDPELTVLSDNGIVYTSDSVTINPSLGYDISNLKPGMVIDTLHEVPYSSIITDVDAASGKITVDTGWYLYNTTSIGLPDNNIGFQVGRITYIWGENIAVHLFNSNPTIHGAIGEYDIINDKTGGTIDGMTFLSKSTVRNGHVIRTIIQDGAEGFNYFAIIDGCTTAIADNGSATTIRKNHTNNSQFLINSQNSEEPSISYNVRNDGRTNHLRGECATITAAGSYENTVYNMLRLDPATDISISIRTAENMIGELFYIENVSSHTVAVNTATLGFIDNGTTSRQLRVHAKESIVLLSDGSYWNVMLKHNNKSSVDSITMGTNMSSFGSSICTLNAGLANVRLMASTTGAIASGSVIATLPAGAYQSIANLAIKTGNGRTATFTVNGTGQITATTALESGDLINLSFTTLIL